ncbi:MAG: hypothetical protein J6Y69_05035 [Treponema sp.]|nr:hypothetical protein [Treponema sp.]
MKKLFLTAICILFAVPVFAQIQPQGFSLGLHGSGMFPLGDYSSYSIANVGGGADLEYVLPENQQPFGDKCKFGVFLSAGFSHSFVKADTPLASLNDILIDTGITMRFPIVNGEKFKMALVPELGGGLIFHMPKAKDLDGTQLKSMYMNPLVSIKPSVRFILPKNLEIMVNPIYTMAFEKKALQHELGLQLGLMWHISDFRNGTN